jgi:hypothetical protein
MHITDSHKNCEIDRSKVEKIDLLNRAYFGRFRKVEPLNETIVKYFEHQPNTLRVLLSERSNPSCQIYPIVMYATISLLIKTFRIS